MTCTRTSSMRRTLMSEQPLVATISRRRYSTHYIPRRVSTSPETDQGPSPFLPRSPTLTPVRSVSPATTVIRSAAPATNSSLTTNKEKEMDDEAKSSMVRLRDIDDDRNSSNTCCCGFIHIRRGSMIIALLSLAMTVTNGVLLCLGIRRTALNFFVEISILIADLTSVVMLFYGVLYKRPSLLKPYLLVNVAWNLALLLLFFVSVAQVMRGNGFSRNILLNIVKISNYRPARSQIDTVATIATVIAVLGLLITIIVNFWFLYVIFLCFQWMNAYSDGESKETKCSEEGTTADKDPSIETVSTKTNGNDVRSLSALATKAYVATV